MGYNFSGLIINKKLDTATELSAILETKLQKMGTTGFENASSSYKEPGLIDVLTTDKGTLVLTEQGSLYELQEVSKGIEIIQFIISDVSSTYYLEKCSDGQLIRKSITSEFESVEDMGEPLPFESSKDAKEEKDFSETLWEAIGSVLQIDAPRALHDLDFARYQTS